MPDVSENLLFELERHCNNYFNPQNDPGGKRNHPPEFLALAKRILKYRNSEQGRPNNLVGESVAGFYKMQLATGPDGLPADWTQVFKRELAAYRRIRFL